MLFHRFLAVRRGHPPLTLLLQAVLLVALALLVLSGCNAPFQAERAYVRGIVDHARRTTAVLERLKTLSAEPRLFDAAWERDVSREIATVRSLVQEAREMDPPDAFTDAHARYLGAMDSLEAMAETYDSALALQNDARLQEALRMAEQTRRQVQQARQQVDELREEHAR